MIFWLSSLWICLTIFWLLSAALWWNGYATVRPLSEITENPADRDKAHETVTVIFAARDEKARIESTVRRILQQRHVDLELAAVNDRSTDETGAILEGLRREDSRVTVHETDSVPDGWIAKSHACSLAARESKADWLLFTDADTWMAPDTLARALQLGQSSGAAHVALIPHSEVRSLVGRAGLLYFLTHGMAMGGLVQRGVRQAFIGIGAFNLIRRETYERFGGHAAFRYELLDDLALGKEVNRLGERTVVADGMQELRVAWAEGPLGLVRATDKNFFAVVQFSLLRAVIASALLCLAPLTSLAAPLLTATIAPDLSWLRFLSWLPLLTMPMTWIPYRIGAGRAGWGWAAALPAPLGCFTMAAAIINSAWVTLRGGGVRWRDTFYPLSELRAYHRR